MAGAPLAQILGSETSQHYLKGDYDRLIASLYEAGVDSKLREFQFVARQVGTGKILRYTATFSLKKGAANHFYRMAEFLNVESI